MVNWDLGSGIADTTTRGTNIVNTLAVSNPRLRPANINDDVVLMLSAV